MTKKMGKNRTEVVGGLGAMEKGSGKEKKEGREYKIEGWMNG